MAGEEHSRPTAPCDQKNRLGSDELVPEAGTPEMRRKEGQARIRKQGLPFILSLYFVSLYFVFYFIFFFLGEIKMEEF